MEKRQVEILFRQHYRRMYAANFEWIQAKKPDEDIIILNSFNQNAITRQDNTITIE